MTKVTIQRDIVLNLIVPLTATHDFIPLPPVPPVPPPLPAAPLSLAACAIESPVNAWWPPGYALGGNKFTTSVFHSGMGICLESHDCGKFIPHVQVAPAPNNTLTLIHIPLSSRKCNFTASTVKMNGKPTACMLAISWPPSPMTYCSNPMSMPLADAPTAHLNTVTVGMTFGDWFAGAFAIAAGMLLEWAMFRMTGGASGFISGAAGKTASQIITSKLVGSVLPSNWGRWAIGQGVAILTGAVRVAATGQGEFGPSLTIGGPFLSLKIGLTISRSNETGWDWKLGATGTAGNTTANLDTTSAGVSQNHPLGLGSEGVSHNWSTGTTATETSVDPFDGFHNRTTTMKPDGTTTVADSHAGSSVSNPL